MTLLLATNNPHKKAEMNLICAPHTVRTPDDLGIDFHHEETGLTFSENSMGKARALAQLVFAEGSLGEETPIAVIADDSGICVDALDGAPGVYTARFGRDEFGRQPTQEEQNQLLLTRLEQASVRRAHYTCSMTALCADRSIIPVEDYWFGTIAERLSSGGGGFGYDPLFIPDGMSATAADMTNQEKHAQSHRGKATRKLLAAIAAGL